MCAKLLILESPGKVKKVQEILGSGWKVAVSVGHVCDLPVKEMGVSAPDFKPQYIPTDRGKDVLSRLAGMVKNAEEVFLATDPDREGEAIAWHLQEALKLKNAKRVRILGSTSPDTFKLFIDGLKESDQGVRSVKEWLESFQIFPKKSLSSSVTNLWKDSILIVLLLPQFHSRSTSSLRVKLRLSLKILKNLFNSSPAEPIIVYKSGPHRYLPHLKSCLSTKRLTRLKNIQKVSFKAGAIINLKKLK